MEIGTKLLKFVGEKAGGGAVGKLFEMGLNFLKGGSDSDKMQEKIDEVFKEVQQVKAAVAEVSEKLDKGFLKLRQDILQNSLDEIEALYSGVQDCLDRAFKAKKEITDQGELGEHLTKLQQRLEEKLKLAANMVPDYIGHIDRFLQDREFLNAAAKLALEGSHDFLAYYMKMKVLVSTTSRSSNSRHIVLANLRFQFVPYLVIVVKGITLLEMARLAPKVNFAEAPETIKRLSENLKAHENAFTETVGHNTCELAEYFLAEPTSKRAVSWYSGWGNGIKIVEHPWDEALLPWLKLFHLNIEAMTSAPFRILRVLDDHSANKYLLEITTAVSTTKFDLGERYPVRIWSAERSDHVTRGRPELDEMSMLQMWTDPAAPDSKWYIKPVDIGSDHYRFVAADGHWMNNVLVTDWSRARDLNFLQHKPNTEVDANTGFDKHPDRGYFMLSKWS
jgi:hypothetical protein